LLTGIVLIDHLLHRTHGDKVNETFWLDHWSLTRFSPIIVLVRQLLIQIGGPA
jgi:hypothetical protein